MPINRRVIVTAGAGTGMIDFESVGAWNRYPSRPMYWDRVQGGR
jgi:hypothetical protein